MFKTPLILSLATCGLLAAGSASAADQTNGWFVNGNVGTAHYKATVDGLGTGTENNTAFMVNGGYRSQGILGFEAGYTNLGSVSETIGGDRAKLRADGWTLGLNGHFNFTDHWYLSARGGLFLWKLKLNATYTDVNDGRTTLRADKQSIDWYAGIGTGWDINRHWSVGANFDYYKIGDRYQGVGYDVGSRIFSVGAEYRF